ncbi:MAG: hypothetical protein MZV63_67070 [Marinilabiliales bacterium]|nr:hypothetical protein [Marinilabiliales bacterium]
MLALVLSAGWIWQRMDSTTEDSSADLGQHLRSASNISTDQSNLERINRWKCALRMFAEKPLCGMGSRDISVQLRTVPESIGEDRYKHRLWRCGQRSQRIPWYPQRVGPARARYCTCSLTIAAVITGIRVWYREKRGACRILCTGNTDRT